MEASKLTINPDHLKFRPLAPGKKAALRRENIKALIKGKAVGTVITNAEFAAVTNTSEASAYSMIATMARHGEISRSIAEGTRNRYCYVVHDEATKTHRSAPKPRTVERTFTLSEVVDAAKTYAWKYDNDSLRGFIDRLYKGEE